MADEPTSFEKAIGVGVEQALNDLANSLKPFGTVDKCHFIERGLKLEVFINDFRNVGKNPFECGSMISAAFPGYSLIDKMSVDDGMYHLILKSKWRS